MNRDEERLTWDEIFMGVAQLSARRSRDPNTQVGACIVKDNKIVSTGYNGMPRTCDDKDLPMTRNSAKWLENKYPYIVHAELNAILNSISHLKGCTIYVSLFPCHECVKAIIQSGIQEIIYEDDKYNGTDSDRAAKRMLDAAGVKYTKIAPIHLTIEK